MTLIAERLNYGFYEPMDANPKYAGAVIVLGNSPASPLQDTYHQASGYEGQAGYVAHRVADATGALVCAYERPGSTDTRPHRDIRAALKPGFAYKHTLGQTARALSAAILERKPDTTQILLAGHSTGANYSLGLAEHSHPILFPVTNLSLVNPLRAEVKLGTKLWHFLAEPRLKRLTPMRRILTDAFYYAPTTKDVRERLSQFAMQRRDVSMYVCLPYSLSVSNRAEELVDELNQARPSLMGPKTESVPQRLPAPVGCMTQTQ